MKLSSGGSHLAPGPSSAGRCLSPSVRRTVAPAGKSTCGPAPALCFPLFIKHRRNDLIVLVVERGAGSCSLSNWGSAGAAGRRRVPPVRLGTGPGQGAPGRPNEKTGSTSRDHRGNRSRGPFGWLSKIMNLRLPGPRCWARDVHVSRENYAARTLPAPSHPCTHMPFQYRAFGKVA